MDENKLSQLEDRHNKQPVEETEEQQAEPEETPNESDSEKEVEWKPLTLYLTEEIHTEFNKPFFMRLQLEHPQLMEPNFMKREFQQAAIEVAMEHEDEVAARAEEIHQRVNSD